MNRLIDYYLLYQLVTRLATPFTATAAFKRGIIDKDGNVLRQMNTLKEPADKAAWTHFDVLVTNLKRLLGKLPAANALTLAAALYLLREPPAKVRQIATEEELREALATYIIEAKQLNEDAPANAVGTGAIAGAGVGPQGEPGKRLNRRKWQSIGFKR